MLTGRPTVRPPVATLFCSMLIACGGSELEPGEFRLTADLVSFGDDWTIDFQPDGRFTLDLGETRCPGSGQATASEHSALAGALTESDALHRSNAPGDGITDGLRVTMVVEEVDGVAVVAANEFYFDEGVDGSLDLLADRILTIIYRAANEGICAP
jgi:hypothetical protein